MCRRLSTLLAFLSLVLTSNLTQATEREGTVTVFAAASLTDVLPVLAEEWIKSGPAHAPRFSFGPSATMARQVAAGAPAHIVLSANPDWVKYLADKDLLAAPAVPILQNRLVLVMSGSGHASTTALTTERVSELIGDKKLAIADPAVAPAGAYAKSYLETTGLWDTLSGRIAMGSNVRQTLTLAERGGLPAFVYATDARRSNKVDIVGVVPSDATPPILYTAGRTKLASGAADNFFVFLSSPGAASIWATYGFEPYVSK